jgi:SAM-dependent methyltransferase
MHANSELIFKRYATAYFPPGARVLEVGPDSDPSAYRLALGGLDLRWETAELDPALMRSKTGWRSHMGPPTHLMRTEYEIPTPADSFDVVLAGQVIEHVRRIWEWVPELARVAKPGGTVIIISPISWPHHASPYDCWRIYPDGMQALCDEAGLEVLISHAESLEPVSSRRRYPGIGHDWYLHRNTSTTDRRIQRLRGLLGWPMPAALDLITVARKTVIEELADVDPHDR